MVPKHVAVVGAICVTIGWLLASTMSPPVARVQSLSPERPARANAAQAELPVAEQIRLPRSNERPAPEGRRNLFSFATRESAAVGSRQAERETTFTPAAEVAPVVLGPTYILSGIGITGGVRTAVLATDTSVNIVGVNDVIGDYTVTEITDQTVVLTRGEATYTHRHAQKSRRVRRGRPTPDLPARSRAVRPSARATVHRHPDRQSSPRRRHQSGCGRGRSWRC